MESILNKSTTLNTIVAAVAWVAGVAIMVFDVAAEPLDNIGFLGLACCAFGATRQVGGYIAESKRREREWFELGKDVGGSRPRSV